MIKLVKNELYKIFHKKFIYILLITVLGAIAFFSTTEKIFKKYDISEDIAEANQRVQMYEADGITAGSPYFESKANLETLKMIKERNYSLESPEYYYVSSTIQDDYYSYYSAFSDDYKAETKSKLEEDLAFLDNFDWKEIINRRIEQLKEKECNGEKRCEEENAFAIRVEEYRLNHNIPYANTDASNELDGYVPAYSDYLLKKDLKEDILEYDEVYAKRNAVGDMEEKLYILDHELLTSDYKGNYTATDLILSFSHVNLLTSVVLLMLSATVVAEEYSKGTIKQLLVKPYSRTRIIVSKFIAVMIAMVAVTFVYNIAYSIIISIYYGDISTIFTNHVIYDFNTSKCIEINYMVEALVSFVYSLPSMILLGLFTFTMALITTNTAFALGLGFGAYLSESLFQLYMTRIKILSYSPTVNYNFDAYMWGRITEYEDIFLSKSIIISVISFVVLTAIAIIVFNKKDIKNQ